MADRATTEPAAKRPTFFVVGHPKCGTTALAEALGRHPELFMSTPKEPRYFCPEWWDRGVPTSARVERTEAEYLSLFAPAADGQICGEATSIYLYSPGAAELIQAFSPGARIVMLFREPASFLRSYHLQQLKNTGPGTETVESLREAIALEGQRREDRELPPGCAVPELLFYTTGWLRYEEHFDRFAARFPPEQLLALTYEDFEADNPGTVRRIFRFLGVDDSFAPRVARSNVGGAQARPLARALVRKATHGEGALGPVKRLTPKRFRPWLSRFGNERIAFKPAAPLDESLAVEIRKIAAPHVDALGRRLDRDLVAEWRLPPGAGNDG
jgi:hypothetical protein